MSFFRSSVPERGERLRRIRCARFVAPFVLSVLAGCGPRDGSRELAAGRAAYEAGDLKGAEELLLESERLNATNVDTQVCLALVGLARGDLAEAERHIANAEASASGDLDVRLAGAQIAWHAKAYDKALAAYRALAEDASLDPSVRARGWTGQGIVQMTNNAYDLARISFLQAIRLDRRNAAARYHLGHLYRYAPFGYPEAALEQFESYVRLVAEADARVRKTQRSVIPGLKDEIARAASDRPGASSRNSAVGAAALSKAEAAWKKGSYKVAATEYRNALSADPLAYPAALGLARVLLKTDSSAAGQRKALDAYRTACSLRPGSVATFVEAGALAERLGQAVVAREIYSRAVAANPASASALDGLIRSCRKAGDKAVANAYQRYRDSLSQPVRK